MSEHLAVNYWGHGLAVLVAKRQVKLKNTHPWTAAETAADAAADVELSAGKNPAKKAPRL